jgi:hypothetical protein
MVRVESRITIGGIAPREWKAMRMLRSPYMIESGFDDLDNGQHSSRYVLSRTLVLGLGCCRRDGMRSAVFLCFAAPTKSMSPAIGY